MYSFSSNDFTGWYWSKVRMKWEFDIFHVDNFSSDTALIKASMAYCANVIGTLLYLLQKILNLITTFFLFLTFLIPDFMKFWVFFVLLFILFFNFRIWLELHFLIIFFHFSNFQVFTLFIYQLHFRIFQILCYLISNFGFIRYFSLRYCLIGSLLSWYLLKYLFFLFWIVIIFSFLSKQIASFLVQI